MDRALPCDGSGRWFDSSRAYSFSSRGRSSDGRAPGFHPGEARSLAAPRLDDAVKTVGPAVRWHGLRAADAYAQALRREIDTFVIYTDSETWAGDIHPVQALRDYRHASGIDARLVVVGMVSNGFSIADPADAGMLDVVGFDTATPQLIADFARGTLYRARRGRTARASDRRTAARRSGRGTPMRCPRPTKVERGRRPQARLEARRLERSPDAPAAVKPSARSRRIERLRLPCRWAAPLRTGLRALTARHSMEATRAHPELAPP